jgi:UDP-N-acetylmuramate dehydrogenase
MDQPTVPTPAHLRELDRLLGPGRVERNVPLAPYTTFQIGGPADALFRPRDRDELVGGLEAARSAGVPWFLMGRGANILVGDRGFRGLIVLSLFGEIEFLEGSRVRADAGVETYPDLIDATVDRGLGGLHHFVGIPSTVGGAIWQNLHFLSPAPERERTVFIEEVVEAAELWTEEGERRTVDAAYFRFGYDYSVLHDRDDVVLSVTFRLTPEDPGRLRRIADENLEWRKARHPDLSTLPCAGSVFRKIDGTGAGRLIDECGLRGHRYGSAEIYHEHANIIVNLGGATASDVMHLIDLAHDTVLRETGHELVPEISFVGEF